MKADILLTIFGIVIYFAAAMFLGLLVLIAFQQHGTTSGLLMLLLSSAGLVSLAGCIVEDIGW